MNRTAAVPFPAERNAYGLRRKATRRAYKRRAAQMTEPVVLNPSPVLRSGIAFHLLYALFDPNQFILFYRKGEKNTNHSFRRVPVPSIPAKIYEKSSLLALSCD